jgi:CysZ protein
LNDQAKEDVEAVGSEIKVISRPSRRCPRCGTLPDIGEKICSFCQVDIASPEAKLYHKINTGAVGEFFRGIGYFPKGLYFLLRHRKLWIFAIIPTIINIFVLAAAFYGAWQCEGYLTDGLAEKIIPWKEGPFFWDQVLWGLSKLLIFLAEVLSFLLIPLLVAFLFSLFGKFLFMPFMELLSEKSEKIYLGKVIEEGFSLGRFSSDLMVSMFNGALVTICQIATTIILFPLHLVPIVGSLLWLLIPGCFFSSMDYTDMNFVRRRYDISSRLQVWFSRKWRFLGFGFAFFFFLGTPILNILTGTFVIPVACVGGTLLFLELDAK